MIIAVESNFFSREAELRERAAAKLFLPDSYVSTGQASGLEAITPGHYSAAEYFDE